MYSIAQQAVANGYGKIEYFRAHAIARSIRVNTIASPRSALSVELTRRGADGGGSGFGTRSCYLEAPGLSKGRLHSRGARATGPRRMDDLTRWVHLLGLAVYLGSTLALVLMLLPAVEQVADPAEQRRLLAKGLRPYNVLSIGALGVLVISGASGLTDLKAMLGANFMRLMWPLLGKLTLSFVLINVATYLSFGLAHRLVRAEVAGFEVEPEKQRAMLGRMRGAAWLAVALTVWISWMGLRLTQGLRSMPPRTPAPAGATP